MAEAGASSSWRSTFATLGRKHEERPTYDIFIGFLTILSLIVLVLIVVVRSPQVDDILTGTDTLLCLVFLGDTVRSWWQAPDRRAYLIGAVPGRSLPTGVIDLVGCIPWVRPLRLLRLARLRRVGDDLRGQTPSEVVADVVDRRAAVAVYLIATAAILVLLIGSSLVAFAEPNAPGSNIKTGGDAFWWAFVTITTVGYGDRYPVTPEGRLIGMITMAVGIGIFGVFTSVLAQLFLRSSGRRFQGRAEARAPAGAWGPGLVGPGSFAAQAVDDRETANADQDPAVDELRALRGEIAELRAVIEARGRDAPELEG